MSLASAIGCFRLEGGGAGFGVFALGFGLLGGKIIKPGVGAAAFACKEIPFHCFDGIKCHATAGGEKFLEQAFAIVKGSRAKGTESLTEAEIQQLRTGLQKIIKNLE